jgi:hypothetical protein
MISPYARHQWGLSLGRQNTSYTELYFNDGSTLPSFAERGKAIRVSFRVSNDGAAPVSYRYVISSGSGTKLDSLTSSSRTVGPGQTWTVNRMVLPSCAQRTCRVQIALPAENEDIYFLFDLTNVTSGLG